MRVLSEMLRIAEGRQLPGLVSEALSAFADVAAGMKGKSLDDKAWRSELFDKIYLGFREKPTETVAYIKDPQKRLNAKQLQTLIEQMFKDQYIYDGDYEEFADGPMDGVWKYNYQQGLIGRREEQFAKTPFKAKVEPVQGKTAPGWKVTISPSIAEFDAAVGKALEPGMLAIVAKGHYPPDPGHSDLQRRHYEMGVKAKKAGKLVKTEGKAFAHGTVREWKRGKVMKSEKTWNRLPRERAATYQPVPEYTTTTFGGDPYGPSSPYVSDALATLASKISESDAGTRERDEIVKALVAGYKTDGLDGLKAAAYTLEAEGVSKMMLSSVLKGAIRDRALEGVKLVFKGWEAETLGMYADDLKRGR